MWFHVSFQQHYFIELITIYLGLSKELSWLIFKMMSHNPKERPEAQEILSDEHVQKRETARRKFVEERIYKNAGSGDVQSLVSLLYYPHSLYLKQFV